MSDSKPLVLDNFPGAEAAFKEVSPEAEALDPATLHVINVDLVGSAALMLGHHERIVPFRERLARLPDFDIRLVDKMPTYANALWFVAVTSLSGTENTGEYDTLFAEVVKLRAKFNRWAGPLMEEGIFDPGIVDKIRENSGNKDTCSDAIAYTNLYQTNWDAVKSICSVTQAELARAAEIAPLVFGMIARRENKMPSTIADNSRSRRFFTLADRSWFQIRRGIEYWRAADGDVDLYAPSLRRNAGPRASSASTANTTTTPEPAASTSTEPSAEPAGPTLGGGSSPFGKKP